MFTIGETIIEEDIAYERFACNLSDCKGACCTLQGGRGAPVRDDEVPELLRVSPFVRQYLSKDHLQVMDNNGIVEGEPGNYATVCVGHKACVFVFHEHDTARCSIERAYLAGQVSWRKPLSCHLFPVRITIGSQERLRYEKILECSSAREYGLQENIQL
ncbi:MAG: DUF3109 family protein [Ignavibacteriales bacterium]|nr:DUF3109 family protein [Ignavibacteriales bacterium]